MNDPQNRLTPAVQELICAYIRAGGFPHVAAEAAGVPVKVFERWMTWGQSERPVAIYRAFYRAVRQAEAQARLAAENKTFQKAALSWLRSGPGRATNTSAGWTSPVKALPLAGTEAWGEWPKEFYALCEIILEALGPFPEARVAVAQKLAEGGWDKDPAAEAMRECEAELDILEVKERDASVEVEEQREAAVGQHEAMRNREPRTENEERTSSAAGDDVTVKGGGNLHRNRIEAYLKAQRPTCNEPVVNPHASAGEASAKPVPSGLSPWDSLTAGHWIVGFG